MKSVTFLSIIILGALHFHNTIATDYQISDSQPAKQGASSISTLQKELKTPQYCKEILPNNFSYLTDLLQYGNDVGQPRAYIRSVFKLFSNLLKGAEYVNAYAFSDLIDQFPSLIKQHLTAQESRTYLNNTALYDANMFDRFKATVNNMLYMKFSTEYEAFKQNPEQFLENISNDIVKTVQEEVSIEQLRQGVIRFCEVGLGKLIWSPEDQEKTWHCVKSISNRLATLLEHNILDDVNDLDDLYWTLVHRYCFFIDITNADMPVKFYQNVKNDIASQQLLLFELDEQDTNFIEPKIQFLTRTLLNAEAKSRAFEQGILTRS